MNPRVTLVLVAVLAALAVVYYGVNRSATATGVEAGQPTPQPTLFTAQSSAIHKLTVQSGNQQTVVQQNAQGTWLLEPGDKPADDARISSVVIRLATVQATGQVQDAKDLNSFGLAQPSITATMEQQGGNPIVLLIGNQTPVGTGYYAKTQAGSGVFIIPSVTVDDLKQMLSNPPTPPPTPTPRPSVEAVPAPVLPTPTGEATPAG